jgi:hypothetical protein
MCAGCAGHITKKNINDLGVRARSGGLLRGDDEMSDSTELAPWQIKARDLTDEEDADWTEQARELHRQFVQIRAADKQLQWAGAKVLYEFDQMSGWLKNGCESKTEWLALPEVDVKYDVYQQMVRVYGYFVVFRQVDFDAHQNVGPAQANVIHHKVRHGSIDIDDALRLADSLSYRDLQREINQAPEFEDEPKKREDGDDPDATGTTATGNAILGVAGEDDDTNLPTNGQSDSGQLTDDQEAFIRSRVALISRQLVESEGEELTPVQEQAVSAVLRRSKGLVVSGSSTHPHAAEAAQADGKTSLSGVLVKGRALLAALDRGSQSRLTGEVRAAKAEFAVALAEVEES